MTQVTCITKRQHQNPHERIQGIGGVGWWRSEDDAIRHVERDLRSYYVTVGGQGVWAIVAKHNGRKYLKTETDGYVPNNLLSLVDPAVTERRAFESTGSQMRGS